MAEPNIVRVPFPMKRLRRFRLRKLLWLAAGGLIVYMLLPHVGSLQQTLDALRDVHWGWLAAGIGISTSIHVLGAVSQLGAIEQPMSLRRMTIAQMASGFANRFGPPGIGSAVVMTRFLERHDLDRSVAFGAVALKTAAGSVVHVGLLAIVLALLGDAIEEIGHLPTRWSVVAVAALGMVLVGVVLWTPLGRHRFVVPVVRAATQLATTVRQPRQALKLFGGAAGAILASSVTLLVSLYAFDAPASFLHAAAVYLGGMTLGTFSPTPGGLGGVEAALVAGLTLIGIETGPAVAGVLLFRLHTFWLPTVPGFVAFRYLRQQEYL